MKLNNLERINIPSDLIGHKVYLRCLKLEDCQEYYVSWLNDPEVNQFLETRFYPQSIESIKDFVSKTNNSNHSYLCAIVTVKEGRHIGNIKVGPLHPFYKRIDISYFIGDRDSWGKGYASEAVWLMTKFAFRDLEAHKVKGLVREYNLGSRKVLEKVGFKLEGILKSEEKLSQDSPWEDVYCYAMFYQNFQSNSLL
jgi:RimJ/RimL family protein N-acetyltransferase